MENLINLEAIMTKLECNVDHCVNNEKNCCCRPDILISGRQAIEEDETCCSSFAERSHASINEAENNNPEPLTEVRCEADHCIYNDDLECAADFIVVDGNYAKRQCDTQCDSFDCRPDAY